MKLLSRIFFIVDQTSEWTGKVVSFLILPVIIFVCYDVVMRYVFNRPTQWADELAYLMYGTLWMIGGAYALKNENHVKMEIFYNRLSSRGRSILDLVTAPLFFLFVGILLWKGGEFAWSSIERLETSNSYWGPPLYPIKTMIPIGAFMLLMQGLVKFIRDLVRATTGREV
jgi:TRAP-type mannitol/chloroaromatic compound transport system permease small subunit